MKRLFLLCTALLAISVARSQSQETSAPDQAVVIGKAETEVVPDEIYLIITISEHESKGKVSIQDQQRAMMKSLAEKGIDTKNLKMKDMATSFYKKGQNLAYGIYELKLSSSETLYTALAVLNRLGIYESRISRIGRSDKEQLRNELMADAMKNARSTAEKIAAADNRKAGRCIYFSYDADYDPMFDNDFINPGTIEFTRLDPEAISMSEQEMINLPPEIGNIKIRVVLKAKFLLE